MDDFVARQEEVDAVPFWERASIRPRELATLKLRVKQLELKAEQSDKEWEIQNELIKYLFNALGFFDWEFSQKGAEDAIKALNDLVTGKTPVEMVDKCESPDGSFDWNLIKLIERVHELEGLAIKEDQWVALIDVLEECKVWMAKLSLYGNDTTELYTQLGNMIALCQKGMVE